jgi:hypothetical protein
MELAGLGKNMQLLLLLLPQACQLLPLLRSCATR